MPYKDPEKARVCKRASHKRWREKNPEKWREHQRATYARLRERVLLAYGGKCVVCGEDRLLALDIEHTDGGGTADRNRSSESFYRRILREHRKDLQVMCGTCHNVKSRGGDPFA